MSNRKILSIVATLATVRLCDPETPDLELHKYKAGRKICCLAVNPESDSLTFIDLETGKPIEAPVWDYDIQYHAGTLNYHIEMRDFEDADESSNGLPVFWREPKKAEGTE